MASKSFGFMEIGLFFLDNLTSNIEINVPHYRRPMLLFHQPIAVLMDPGNSV